MVQLKTKGWKLKMTFILEQFFY